MKKIKYIKQIYNMMLNDLAAHPLKRNWASCVQDLLCQLGFRIVWETQGVGNIEHFLGTFKQRVRDVFCSRMAHEVREFNSCKMLYYFCKLR